MPAKTDYQLQSVMITDKYLIGFSCKMLKPLAQQVAVGMYMYLSLYV